MPITVSHALSATTPDDPQYEIRPSHWNDTHAFTLSASGSEVVGAFSNAGNVTFGLETNGFITASANAAGAGDGFNRIAAGGSTAGTNNTIVFSNSNGISFSLNGNTVTASHNGLTQQSTQPVAFSAPGGSSAFSTLVFANSQGVSWSNSNGSIVASVATNYLTTAAQSNQVVNSLNGSTGQVSLNVGSSLSASTNGSSITFGLASNITTALQSAGAYLTTARASTDAVGLNTAQSNVTWTVNSSGISLDGRGYAGTGTSATNASVTLDSNGLQISVANPGGGGGFTGGVSTGGNTAGQTGTQTGQLIFAGGNNITLSVATAAGGAQTITISGANVGGAQTGISGIVVSNTTYTSGTVSFSNLNGISFGSVNATAISASYTVPTVTNSSLTMQAGASTLSSVSRVAFADSNGVSFGASTSNNGSITITATVRTDWLSTQSNQAFSASGGSSAFQTLNFANSNGLTFSNSNGSVVGSYTVPTQTAQTVGLYASSQTTAQSSSSTVDARSISIVGQGNISVGLSAGSFIISQTGGGGGVNPAASASNGSFAFTTLNFSNANNVTFGTSAGGIITASVAAPGAAAEQNAINLLGANTAGNTTATGSTIGLSGINLTLSGTNASQVVFSAPATSSLVGTSGISISTNGSTISVLHVAESYKAVDIAYMLNTQTYSVAQSTSIVWPGDIKNVESVGFFRMPQTVLMTSMASIATTANTTISSGQSHTYNLVAYTRGTGGSSQSLQSVASTTWSSAQSMNFQANANGSQWSVTHGFSYPGTSTGQITSSTSYATTLTNINISTTHLTAYTGAKLMGVPWSTQLDQERHWFAFGVSTSLATQASASFSNAGRINTSGYGLSQVNLTWGEFGAANNASIQAVSGVGSFTTNAIATTASLGFSNISSSASHMIPYITFGRVA